MKRFLALFLCFLLLVPVVAFAHPGNTDSRGGHFDRDTGEYHFHHGYPAHQHRNGQCPYDHDDRTGERSGSSSSGNRSNSSRTGSNSIGSDGWSVSFLDILPYIFVFFCLGLFFFPRYIGQALFFLFVRPLRALWSLVRSVHQVWIYIVVIIVVTLLLSSRTIS